jgi:hypothetical protein
MEKINKKTDLNLYFKYDKRNNKHKVNLIPIIFDYNYLIVNFFLLIPYLLITIIYFFLFFYSSKDFPER